MRWVAGCCIIERQQGGLNIGITIKDIARESGFSKSTVSRVLVDDENVKASTREKIQAVMEQMGYENNELARSMVRGRINIVLVIVGDLLHSSYASSMREIEYILYEAGYMVVICISEYNTGKELRYLQLAQEFHFAGVILMTALETRDLHQLLEKLQCPVVLVNRIISQPPLDTVLLDNYRGGYDATKYLINKGHRCIFHVSGPNSSNAGLERRRGYMAAMGDAGLPVMEPMVYIGNLLPESGKQALDCMLERLPGATAAMIASNRMAEGFVQACVRRGVKIPEQISIITFDHILDPELYQIPLTTVGNDPGLLGLRAAEILLERIRGEEGPRQTVVYPCEIIEGESVKVL